METVETPLDLPLIPSYTVFPFQLVLTAVLPRYIEEPLLTHFSHFEWVPNL